MNPATTNPEAMDVVDPVEAVVVAGEVVVREDTVVPTRSVSPLEEG